MAETSESFRILTDGLDEGIEYVGKAPGAAASTDEQAPVLPAQDGSGNLQNIPLRAEGDTPSGDEAQPALAFKDSSGNLVYPQLTASGALPVDSGGVAGTAQSASAAVTIAVINTEQDVVAITLGNSESITASMAMGGASQPTVFVLYHDDNSSLTEIARFIVGPGDVQHSTCMDNITFTTGAAGVQRMVLRATQTRGALTDAHGTISLLNLG